MAVSLAEGPFPEHVRKAPIDGVRPLFCCYGGLPRPRPPIRPPPLPDAKVAIGLRWSLIMLINEYSEKYISHAIAGLYEQYCRLEELSLWKS